MTDGSLYSCLQYNAVTLKSTIDVEQSYISLYIYIIIIIIIIIILIHYDYFRVAIIQNICVALL